MSEKIRHLVDGIGFEIQKVPYTVRYSSFRTWALTLATLSFFSAVSDDFDGWQLIISGELAFPNVRGSIEMLCLLAGITFSWTTTEVHFKDNSLSWRYRAFLVRWQREIPYEHFKGLKHFSAVRRESIGETTKKSRYQNIDLVHDDPRLTIRLFSKMDDRWNDAARLETYARFFALPIIQEQGRVNIPKPTRH
ncbi:MAG: hypothetical protein HEP70_16375 [Rhodobiaceae bacterium]|nr:hypothetical protein [Rhodobiaceae bacterium]